MKISPDGTEVLLEVICKIVHLRHFTKHPILRSSLYDKVNNFLMFGATISG